MTKIVTEYLEKEDVRDDVESPQAAQAQDAVEDCDMAEESDCESPKAHDAVGDQDMPVPSP